MDALYELAQGVFYIIFGTVIGLLVVCGTIFAFSNYTTYAIIVTVGIFAASGIFLLYYKYIFKKENNNA